MKTVIAVLVLTFTISSQAQNYRKIVPFKYQSKWGIVDSLNREIAKPEYTSLHVFDDFLYAEFDGKDLYNLKTGEKQKAPGIYINTIEVDGEKYHIFNTAAHTILVNFEKKETIQLTEKYKYIKTIPLYNHEDKKVNTLIIGVFDNHEVKLLKNDKNLTPISSTKFTNEAVETIEKRNKIIGFAYRDKGYFVFYNHDLKIIKKIKTLPKSKDDYEFFTSDVLNKLPVIYGEENASIGCLNCASIWDNSWDLNTFLGDSPEESNYYITKENRDYFLKNNLDANFKIEVDSNLYDYEESYEMININSTNSSFFCDSRIVKTPHILFPEKYLK